MSESIPRNSSGQERADQTPDSPEVAAGKARLARMFGEAAVKDWKAEAVLGYIQGLDGTAQAAAANSAPQTPEVGEQDPHAAAKDKANARHNEYMEAAKNLPAVIEQSVAAASGKEVAVVEADAEQDDEPTDLPKRASLLTRMSVWNANRRAKSAEKRIAKFARSEGESDADYADRLKKLKRMDKIKIGLGVAAGAGLILATRGHALEFINSFGAEDIDLASQETTDTDAADAEANEADAAEAERQARIDEFRYDRDTDPAFHTNKDFPNDFGSRLGINPDTDKLFPGYGDWTDNRLKNNPTEFAAFLAESNMEGAPHPSDIEGVNRLGEELRANPERYADLYDQFMEKLNDPDTKIELKTITTPYESWYITEDGRVMYDGHVDHGGTVTVITFKDGTVLNLRNDCGQPIELLPEQVYVAPPQGTGPAPQQTYNYAPQPQGTGPAPVESTPEQPYVPPAPEPPKGSGPPPVAPPPAPERPPVAPPPTPEVPPVTPPPVEPPPVVPPAEEWKGEAYPDHGSMDTSLGSGELRAPDKVETVIETETGRDIGGGQTEASIIDTVTNDQGSQTGGRDKAPDVVETPLDTSSNSGSGGGVEASSGADSTTSNTGAVESR